ncbi:MAG: hypothetical protein KME16_27985 [Scytolyngbya sp. HA4215-MV1]|nr:hypothetical protein [Scytolyngbya sp. HA4215-MV1]
MQLNAASTATTTFATNADSEATTEILPQPINRPERYSLHIRLLKYSLDFVMYGNLSVYVSDLRGFLCELESRNGWQL